MSQDFFILNSQDFILDPKTRKVVAIIRNGGVFRDDDGRGSPFSLVPTCMTLTAISWAALTGARVPCQSRLENF
jgi:hypothetical protein